MTLLRLHRNALCGKLQCSNVQAVTVFGIEPSIISTPIAGGKCYGVDFMLGSDVPDPGMVNEGSKCGDNKVSKQSAPTPQGAGPNHVRRVDARLSSCGVQVCVNFECSSVDALNYDCDVEKKCHGHGVRHVCPSGVSHADLSVHPSVPQVTHTDPSARLSLRCVTVTETVTVMTAGLHLSVRSKVTEEAWTAVPPGTVPSFNLISH